MAIEDRGNRPRKVWLWVIMIGGIAVQIFTAVGGCGSDSVSCKVSLYSLNWDKAAGEFLIEASVDSGFLERAESEGLQIMATVIFLGISKGGLLPETSIGPAPNSLRRRAVPGGKDALYPRNERLEPLSVPWDSKGSQPGSQIEVQAWIVNADGEKQGELSTIRLYNYDPGK